MTKLQRCKGEYCTSLVSIHLDYCPSCAAVRNKESMQRYKDEKNCIETLTGIQAPKSMHSIAEYNRMMREKGMTYGGRCY